jgi:glucose-6-phosphate 1-dehydrogenase
MAQLNPVDPFDLVIFGGAGDLALRKLLPALWHRHCDGQLPPESRIIGVGRSPLNRDEYLALVAESIEASFLEGDEQTHWPPFAKRIDYVEVDAMDADTWDPLCACLEGRESVLRAIYLATPPSLYGPVARGFHQRNLMVPNMRIVLEKPVGRDFASARDINDEVGAYFAESQIFRIDHYLGKETVQNLLALRFGNAIFEPLWRREVIDHVQITVAEELGVGDRVGFYDDIGALRDMVQNHLLQLVCLVAMEPPASLDDDAVRDEKIKVLRALKPLTGEALKSASVRAQYLSGAVKGQLASSYEEELGSPSQTETFVALKLEIDNWRWSGVPFYLRTGKRLPEKYSEIVIQFKPVPHTIFDARVSATLPNRLAITLQPDEGVNLTMMAKEPGPGEFSLRPVSLDLSFEETFGIRYPDAYERLVIEVLRGNQALFMRRDEIEAAWRWSDGILEGWAQSKQSLETYVAGSWGPSAASMMLDRSGRAWN